MREQIKQIAEELLVKHGYRGLNFRQIAEALNTTRANLHYHFGSKEGLVEAVLDEYATRTMDSYRDVLTDPSTTLRAKSRTIIEMARSRYKRYNPTSDEGEPWSLMTRLRSDSDALSDTMRNRLQAVTSEFELLSRLAVKAAVQSGELRPDTPQDGVTVLITTVLHYQGLITRDVGRFTRLVELWESTLDAIYGAWGQAAAPTAAPKAKAAAKR
ncbi:TetR/AcrR family transcriptional regulator [Acidovorax facilis]|uniref:TetR/AcrR family transcriptional regulator n=1 Tax=Acidovorax facilis TaxID=12917 RepID=UPI003D646701